jgi:acetyl esterase/lipase
MGLFVVMARPISRRAPLRCALAVVIGALVTGTVWAAEPAIKVVRNREYVKRDSGPLAMDVYMPRGAGPFPGVLVVHGGAWTMGSRVQLAAIANALAEHGYVAACVSYRLAPKHTFPAQIDDCQAAVRWLREHASEFRLDPARLGGFGYSAGGQLVALLGTLDDDDYREKGVSAGGASTRLQVVVAGGAPCDFRVLPEESRRLAYWLGGTRKEKSESYRIASPAAFISDDDPPMFFFHGARDLLVPAHSPQRMVAMLSAAGVAAEMHVIDHAGHMEALFDRPTLEQALEFADKYLKSRDTNLANESGLVEATKPEDGGGDAPARFEKGNGASDGE